MNHPVQPLYRDKHGSIRFHANGIVRRLVEHKLIDLCAIPNWMHAHPGITQDDIDQFWQLIGYSVGGYIELAGSDLISEAAADRAEAAAKELKSLEHQP